VGLGFDAPLTVADTNLAEPGRIPTVYPVQVKTVIVELWNDAIVHSDTMRRTGAMEIRFLTNHNVVLGPLSQCFAPVTRLGGWSVNMDWPSGQVFSVNLVFGSGAPNLAAEGFVRVSLAGTYQPPTLDGAQ
jgi:hypothetical protein